MTTLVGFTGFAQSGKNTAADALLNDGFKPYAFADKLREVTLHLDPRLDGDMSVSMLLEKLDGDWDKAEQHRVYGPELQHLISEFNRIVCIDTFGDDSKTRQELREDILLLDPFLNGHVTLSYFLSEECYHDWDGAKTDRIYGFEVRRLLQKMGTEVVRENYGMDAWIDVVAQKIAEEKPEQAVITDVRFENEAIWVRDNGGSVLRIARPGVGPVNNHVSDKGLHPNLVNQVIQNDSTVKVLHERVRATLAPVADLAA